MPKFSVASSGGAEFLYLDGKLEKNKIKEITSVSFVDWTRNSENKLSLCARDGEYNFDGRAIGDAIVLENGSESNLEFWWDCPLVPYGKILFRFFMKDSNNANEPNLWQTISYKLDDGNHDNVEGSSNANSPLPVWSLGWSDKTFQLYPDRQDRFQDAPLLRPSPFYGSGEDWSSSALFRSFGKGQETGRYRFFLQDGHLGVSYEATCDTVLPAVRFGRHDLTSGPTELKMGSKVFLQVIATEDPDCWHCALRWSAAENGIGPGYLTPAVPWRWTVVEPYLRGLQTQRSERGISLLPQLDGPGDDTAADAEWWFRYEVIGRRETGWRTVWNGIGGPAKANWDLSFPLVVDQDGAPLRRSVALVFVNPGAWPAARFDDRIVTGLEVTEQRKHSASQTVRFGPFDLVFPQILHADHIKAYSKIDITAWRRRDDVAVPAAISLDLSLNLAVADAQAGNQDPEYGYEFAGKTLKRNRPLVFAVDNGVVLKGPFSLSIHEKIAENQSRDLQLDLTRSAAKSNNVDLVVLDDSPFMSARVLATLDAPNVTIVASWRDTGPDTGEWNIATPTKSFALLIPPQVIGETMVRKPGEPNLAETAPTDFRLSPPGRLVLGRGELGVTRSVAPWNLRRLLGPGPVASTAPGTGLTAAEFELFYGLSTLVRDKRLRIAELEGVIGRLPVDRELIDLVERRTKPPAEGDDEKAIYAKRLEFANQYVDWVKALWQRAAHWQPYVSDRLDEPLLLSDGVSHQIRGWRQSVDPFTQKPAGAAFRQQWEMDKDRRMPLQGGFDFGFESRNIYQEVVGTPVAVKGRSKVLDLSFTSLGGSGAQEAAFAGGKSLVATTTRVGRTEVITIVRYGRIAMLWNRAKHVIVYERTVRQAERFRGEGPAPTDWQAGRALLRKVKEYVEITQDRRVYPDDGAHQRSCGPLVESRFLTTVIPVRSEWGYDVPGGWVMPLASPQPEALYPTPDIRLAFARPKEKGGGLVLGKLGSCHRLRFYTSTEEADADTDRWTAKAGVDFPLLARPTLLKQKPVAAGAPDTRLPDPPAIEPGFEDFTLDLDCAGETVNLMHGRQDSVIEALLHNICLARSTPAAEGKTPPETARYFRLLADSDGLARDFVAQMRQSLAAGDVDQKRLEDLGRELQQQAAALERQVPGQELAKIKEGWTSLSQRYADDWTAYFSKRLEEASGELIKEAKAIKVDSIETQRQLSRILDQRLAVLRTELQAARSLPEELQSRAMAAAERLKQEQQRLAETLRVIEDAAARLPLAVEPGKQQFRKLVAEQQAAVLVRFDAMLVEIQQSVRGILDLLETGADRPFRKLRQDLEKKFKELLEAEAQDVTDKIQAIRNYPWNVDLRTSSEAVMRHIETARKDAEAQLSNAFVAMQAVTGQVEQFRSQVATQMDGLKTQAKNLADTLQAQAKQAADNELKDFVNRHADVAKIAGVAAQAQSLLDEIRRAGATAQEIKNAIEDTAQAIEDKWRPAAALIQQAAELDLSNLSPQNLPQKAAQTLALVRSFSDAPIVEGMEFTRSRLAGLFDENSSRLQSTPAAALLNRVAANQIEALGTRLPFEELADRFVPKLDDFKLGDLLPDFAGLKLDKLLPNFDVPKGSSEYDWLRLTHGVDEKTLRAWALCSIDTVLSDGPTELIALGPVAVTLGDARLRARARIEVDPQGGPKRDTHGAISADWMVLFGGSPMLTIRRATLAFDAAGKLTFDMEARNVEPAPALQFLTDLIASVMPSGLSGLSIVPVADGISARLDLPLPDLGGGAFSITNLQLSTYFDVLFGRDFGVRTGCWLAKPTRPFNLSVMALGGGGWFGLAVEYYPGRSDITARLSIGITAGATLAINLAVASGSASVLFFIELECVYKTDGNSQPPVISLGLMVNGNLTIVGMVSVQLSIGFRATYDSSDGSVTGYGWVDVSIKICWCFTLSVSREVTMRLAGERRGSQPHLEAAPASAAAVASPSDIIHQAVEDHFATVAWS